jgi:hypothetical protein
MKVNPYSKSFVITDAVSNNAFNYGRRQAQWNKMPQLNVADLIRVEFSELPDQDFRQVEQGTNIVFEDFDGDGKLISCKGLKHFIFAELPGKIPIYIFDNHNHAFYFWQKEKIKGKLMNGSLLIHIDRHKDCREPASFLDEAALNSEIEIFRYTNTVLNVGNFIPAAQKSGLAGEVINVDSSGALKAIGENLIALGKEYGDVSCACDGGNALLTFQSIILDIDLDFFAPEMDYIDNELKLTVIKKLLPLADAVTIATSPFFIDHGHAIHWLKRIFK